MGMRTAYIGKNGSSNDESAASSNDDSDDSHDKVHNCSRWSSLLSTPPWMEQWTQALQMKSPCTRSHDIDNYKKHGDYRHCLAVGRGPSTPRWMQRWPEVLQQLSPSINSNNSSDSFDGNAVRGSPSPCSAEVKTNMDAFVANYHKMTVLTIE